MKETEEKFRVDAETVCNGLVGLDLKDFATPYQQVIVGRYILKHIWYSIHWPIQLKIHKFFEKFPIKILVINNVGSEIGSKGIEIGTRKNTWFTFYV